MPFVGPPIALANAQVITGTTNYVPAGQPRVQGGVAGLIARVLVSAFTGGATPTATFIVQEQDAFGNWVAVLTSAALNVASGEITLTIFAGAPVTANVSANRPIGPNYRVQVTLQGAPTNATVSVDAQEIGP